jgi:hypothetical protein
VVGNGLEVEGFGDAADGWIVELYSVDGEGGDGFDVRDPGTKSVVVLDAIGGEEGTDGAAGLVVLGAGDADAGGGCVASDLLRRGEARGHGGEDNFACGETISNELLKLLALKASDAAFCNGTHGDNVAGAHEDRSFTRKFTGDTSSEHFKLADDIFDRFEFTVEVDEEARLFAFANEPLAGLEVNVGGKACEAAALLFFNACKERDLFEV